MSTPDHHSTRGSHRAPFNEAGTIFVINFKLLFAALTSTIGYWIWPSDPKWWGFGMIALILWMISLAMVVEVLRAAIKLRAAKKRWKALQALGNAPKNARLAEKHDLRNGGMN